MKKLHLLSSLLLLLVWSTSFTQSFSDEVYPFGNMPSNRSNSDALAVYNDWKSDYVTACSNGRFRVEFDQASQTVSEGIGYGMILSAYANDKTLFDGLWKYYKSFTNQNGVMTWKINGCNGGLLGFNGATDAELDAAIALIVAYDKWGNGTVNYEQDAKNLIAAIKNHEIEQGSLVLKPGDAFGGSSLTNISYYAPGYYRTYGTFTNDESFWNGVADKAYEVIEDNLRVNNAAGGLVSDWCNANGSPRNWQS